MLIEIHALQNHAPNNLNRDDLGAPKTAYFGGQLRTRISSQCLKRSIRFSDSFRDLLGGVRTRRLAKLIQDEIEGPKKILSQAKKVLKECGIETKDDGTQDMLVYTSVAAIKEMARLLENEDGVDEGDLVAKFSELISHNIAVPDMALGGRMLETKGSKIKNTTVEAALQATHAISTHTARPEVDYYVAADDVKGDDAGAAFIEEAQFASACFYKYFSIDWKQLLHNLEGYDGNKDHLAAHTVGAFIKGMMTTTPTGKQNSYAAHNPPEAVIVQIRDHCTPISYANAFAKPVEADSNGSYMEHSIRELAKYMSQMDEGFGSPAKRFFFSPGGRFALECVENVSDTKVTYPEDAIETVKNMDAFVETVVSGLGHDWAEVQEAVINDVQNGEG